MKEMLRYGLTLAIICVIASASLAVVNFVTKPKIFAQAKLEEESSLKEILPGADRFEEVKSGENVFYYKAYMQYGDFAGVAFKASAKGYSSTIDTLVGIDKYGNINAIKVVSQNETPGLGARVTEPPFTNQFKYKRIGDISDVQAITGATISSKAVIDSVRKKTEEIVGLVQELRGHLNKDEK